jgi:hypothetical protein|tara:strand:- start:1185 stop:1964 length:780 start_codon:yes stop_codon:yes gene_type:complete
MVTELTPTDGGQDIQEEPVDTGITDLTPDYEQGVPDNIEDVDTAVQDPVQPVAGVSEVPVAPVEPGQVQPQVNEEQVRQQQEQARKLKEMQATEQTRKWQEDVGKRARQYQQGLENQGMMTEHARDQAKSFIQNEQRFMQQDQQAMDVIGDIQGKQEATLHFMQDNGLIDGNIVEIFRSLQGATTPDQMKREAARMQKDRKTEAELTKLRQGQVQPQTFDSSQGSAEASTSNDRLLKAYENGDRSEAAVRAARNLTLGG